MNKNYNIPQTLEERTLLRKMIKDFVQQKSLCPPVSLKQLESLSDEFLSLLPAPLKEGADGQEERSMRNWLMVEINNQLWIDVVATIPHERRLLMLPKCLSKNGQCEGEYDDLGLLCNRCGRCHIPSLQDHADALDALSIVAEGFTQVIDLVENNVVDAIIGVSCLDSLEKAFPLLVRHAIPGLAIPLNDSGCIDTHVDEDYVMELLSMKSDATHTLLDHEAVQQQVNVWFTRESLATMLVPATDLTSRVSLDWMSGEGKRWRPYLLSAVWQSLMGTSEMTEDVHRSAVAVECFHKASLIHDDIEDRDMTRYGKPTINAQYGDTFAINVGDALLGEGYRILSQSNNPELVRLIAQAHMKLCKGQGAELVWCASPTPVTMDFVIDVFRHKTVPAFEVALLLGLSCTNNFRHLERMLKDYSDALGIAYQLKDDREDYNDATPIMLRPSAVLARLCEMPGKDTLVQELLASEDMKQVLLKSEYQPLLQQALFDIKELEDHYRQQALDAINAMDSIELKRLLYQLTEKILGKQSE